MKFAYIDESGTGDEPFAVMAGVVIDAQRMRPTKDDWTKLLTGLSKIVNGDIREFHTREFYAGNKFWRGLAGEKRREIINTIFDWFQERRHHVIFSAIDKQVLWERYAEHPFTHGLGSVWNILAAHVCLSVQRANQTQKNNKGNTVLIFDQHDKGQKELANFILNPPAWSATYYSGSIKNLGLDQIVDVPHFVDSRHVGMIQLADCISFFLRRHLELADGGREERYVGERELVAQWTELILSRCTSINAIYPRRRRCDAAEYFYGIAPSRFK